MNKYVALYARTSTLSQSTGLESQVRALDAYTKASGIKDYRLYQDEISGRTEHRPGLDSMLGDIREGQVSQVVVYSLSRFSRSVKHLLAALDEMSSMEVGFVSLTEQLNTSTPTGRAIITIISAIAQLESDLVKERVRNGLINAKAKGVKLGRPSDANTVLIAELLKQKMSYRKIKELTGGSNWLISRISQAVRTPCSENR